MANTITVRVQSADHGTKRIQSKATERIQDFLEKVRDDFSLPPSGWGVFKKRDRSDPVKASSRKTLSSYKIKHGDMLYLGTSVGHDVPDAGSPAPSSAAAAAFAQSESPLQPVVLDDVDMYLEKLDGRISRERNEQLCHHGPQGKCFHCVPIEPYDEDYMSNAVPPIKYMSFHSYIRKLTGGVDRGKFTNLENISCKIRPGCKEHPPWPGGICTKCQPNAITLNRQKYRHVDYIQFENGTVMERFLNFWRATGSQRIGFLYGRYEHHKDMPLGIKAVVAAIYEPSQISSKNSVELLDDDKEGACDRVAEQLGLKKVGWICSDLIAEDVKKGTVKHFRGTINSHFLSAEESIMAADFQNKHPNACRLSSENHFGSKFVTVIVTGDSEHQVHFEGYQVSNQGMALVRDNCLIPTKDAPEWAYVIESTNQQYVPDVFYKVKDEYGNEVTQLARPLPVEYLLLDMPVGFPKQEIYTFLSDDSIKPFPTENRSDIGEIQDFHAFTHYMQQFSAERLLDAMSDFHVLLYLATCDMLPLKNHMRDILEAVKSKDADLAHHWKKSEGWATVEQLMESSSSSSPGTGSFVGAHASPLPPIGGASSASSEWTCEHCTFLNMSPTTICEMCGLPK